MTKKYLFVGMAVLLGASLSFFACESATGDPGAAGAPGKNVGYLNAANVAAADLTALFSQADIVTLGPTVATVEGTVPAGKTLVVSRATGTAVGDSSIDGSETLTVEGSVEVLEGAALTATGTTSGGTIVGAAGSVYGEGAVLLPYLTDPDFDNTEGILTYNASTAANKAAGSVTDGTAQPDALDAAGIAGIFAATGGPAALTVYGVTALTAAAVPANKTLTLTGAGNTFTAALDLTSKGNLVVAKGATLTTSGEFALTGDGTTANITINGTLALGESGAVAGKVINNGTITSAGTTTAILTPLVTTPMGTGTVVLSGTATEVLTSGALTQNVEIATSGKLIAPAQTTPFSGSKTITVKKGGTLDFGATAVTSVGATIVNNGTITTAVATSTGLGTLLNLVKAGSGYSAVTASGEITALAANFTVPAGIDLTAASATFATGAFTVTVEEGATASLAAATFAQATGLTVNGELTVGDDATFAALTTASGTGSLTLGNHDFGTKAAFLLNIAEVTSAATTITAAPLTVPATTTLTLTAAAAPTGDVTVNGTLNISGAAAPVGDVTVGTTGTLNVSSSGSLTILAGKALANSGTVVLTDSGSVVLTGHGSVAASGAKLTGTGTLTAGTTEIVGGADGWLAYDGTGSNTVAIAADGSSTASAAAAILTGGTGAGITVTGGESGPGVFTVKGIIDISAAGTVTLRGTGTQKGVLLLKGDGTVPGTLKTGAVSESVTLASQSTSNFMLYPANGSSASANKALVTKDGSDPAGAVVVKGAGGDATSGTVLGSIAGGATANDLDAYIASDDLAANAAAITTGWKVQVPNT